VRESRQPDRDEGVIRDQPQLKGETQADARRGTPMQRDRVGATEKGSCLLNAPEETRGVFGNAGGD